MKKVLPFIVCCLSCISAFANDGALYATGNQLIPVNETDISVKKEVLTLNRVGNIMQVNVYYEFFNPSAEKELLVGFEADDGCFGKDPRPAFPEHPSIRNFKVVINGEPQTFDIAHIDYTYDNGHKVTDEYVIDGQIKGMPKEECEELLDGLECIEPIFNYVYYFTAKFQPGLNIIQHTYDFDLSDAFNGRVNYFPYVLTAANRWANHQIDDFTLLVDMGDRISFYIQPTFWKDGDEWEILGKGRYAPVAAGIPDRVQFHMQHGGIRFHKENFHPDGELNISAAAWTWPGHYDFESFSKQYMPLPPEDDDYDRFTPEQRRIARNLPFAYRGYIFNSKELQDYFESTTWYIPNPDYKADVATLNENEQNWVAFWK